MSASLEDADRILKQAYTMPISMELLLGIRSEYARKGHSVATPLTEEELAHRAEYVQKWEELTAVGVELGYLDHSACYECGGELVPSTVEAHHHWEWDETEEEAAARIAQLPKTVTFPVKTDPNVPLGQQFIMPDDLA